MFSNFVFINFFLGFKAKKFQKEIYSLSLNSNLMKEKCQKEKVN